MPKTFNTKIIFRRALSNQEQFAFWNKVVCSIKKLEVSGVTQFENTLDWGIDYSDSNLNEHEVKKRFSSFLQEQKDIIKNFSFYKR